MAAGTQYNKHLNYDQAYVLDEWLMLAGNYVKTAGGLWVPQKGSDNGEALVQLSGRNVEVVNLVNAMAVTDTNARYYDIDLSRYKDFDFRITNTHDQPLRVGFRTTGPDTIKVLASDGTLSSYSTYGTSACHIVPADAKNIFLSGCDQGITPKKENPFKDFRYLLKLELRFDTAPTTGSMTVDLLGVPN